MLTVIVTAQTMTLKQQLVQRTVSMISCTRFHPYESSSLHLRS